MHADFNKRHEVSHCSSPQLQHYSFPGKLTISVTKCPPNAAPQVRINSCIYLKTKMALTFTLTLLLEIGSKGLDFNGHFVLDVKIERDPIRVISGHKWQLEACVWGNVQYFENYRSLSAFSLLKIYNFRNIVHFLKRMLQLLYIVLTINILIG